MSSIISNVSEKFFESVSHFEIRSIVHRVYQLAANFFDLIEKLISNSCYYLKNRITKSNQEREPDLVRAPAPAPAPAPDLVRKVAKPANLVNNNNNKKLCNLRRV